jgi:hypothetical protein
MNSLATVVFGIRCATGSVSKPASSARFLGRPPPVLRTSTPDPKALSISVLVGALRNEFIKIPYANYLAEL